MKHCLPAGCADHRVIWPSRCPTPCTAVVIPESSHLQFLNVVAATGVALYAPDTRAISESDNQQSKMGMEGKRLFGCIQPLLRLTTGLKA